MSTNTVSESREMPGMVNLMMVIQKYVDAIGRWGSLLVVPLVLITMWDVVSRKVIWVQIFLVEHVSGLFSSTLLQELEWHFHTGLFALVLGYGYIHNRHVRVDLVREHLSLRAQAWIEFVGVSVLMIPYCAVMIYFASKYAVDSYMTNEISASLVGLPNRWIIKSVFLVGIISAFFSGIAVWLQTYVVLFGPKDLRFQLMTLAWPEDRMSGKLKMDLEKEKETYT
jgi:TRAP-type mannitol/chloroaromatic compound transport system permease small subunit